MLHTSNSRRAINSHECLNHSSLLPCLGRICRAVSSRQYLLAASRFCLPDIRVHIGLTGSGVLAAPYPRGVALVKPSTARRTPTSRPPAMDPLRTVCLLVSSSSPNPTLLRVLTTFAAPGGKCKKGNEPEIILRGRKNPAAFHRIPQRQEPYPPRPYGHHEDEQVGCKCIIC